MFFLVYKNFFHFFQKNACIISRMMLYYWSRFEAWLSLVERCVRDAEVASSNLVATTKNTPSHMCEGVFLFLQLFKLTTSNWFGPTEAERRPTRSGGPRPGPTGAERRPQVQLSLIQSLAERHTFSPIPITTNTVEIFITC